MKKTKNHKNRSSKKKSKKKEPRCLMDYPPELRGPSQNRWGGHTNSSLKTYGGKFGASNNGQILAQADKDAWAKANGYA